MRTLSTFLAVTLMLSILSCKNKDKVQKEETTQTTPVEQKPVDPQSLPSEDVQVPVEEKYRFLVSFYSIGQGIDGDVQQKFLDWVNGYAKKVVFEEAHWGREGEVDYCFKLTEL